MRKSCLSGVLMIVLGGCATMFAQTTATANTKDGPCSVTVSIGKASYRAKEPIQISVVTTNVTKKEYVLGHSFSSEPQLDFVIRVLLDGQEQLAPLTKAGTVFVLKRHSFEEKFAEETLPPGGEYVQSVDLRKLYDLGPGSYQVIVSQGKLQTSKLSFTVSSD